MTKQSQHHFATRTKGPVRAQPKSLTQVKNSDLQDQVDSMFRVFSSTSKKKTTSPQSTVSELERIAKVLARCGVGPGRRKAEEVVKQVRSAIRAQG
jgi:hypothetical protein